MVLPKQLHSGGGIEHQLMDIAKKPLALYFLGRGGAPWNVWKRQLHYCTQHSCSGIGSCRVRGICWKNRLLPRDMQPGGSDLGRGWPMLPGAPSSRHLRPGKSPSSERQTACIQASPSASQRGAASALVRIADYVRTPPQTLQ